MNVWVFPNFSKNFSTCAARSRSCSRKPVKKTQSADSSSHPISDFSISNVNTGAHVLYPPPPRFFFRRSFGWSTTDSAIFSIFPTDSTMSAQVEKWWPLYKIIFHIFFTPHFSEHSTRFRLEKIIFEMTSQRERVTQSRKELLLLRLLLLINGFFPQPNTISLFFSFFFFVLSLSSSFLVHSWHEECRVRHAERSAVAAASWPAARRPEPTCTGHENKKTDLFSHFFPPLSEVKAIGKRLDTNIGRI